MKPLFAILLSTLCLPAFGGDTTEYSFDSKPRFEKRDREETYLVLSHQSSDIDIFWSWQTKDGVVDHYPVKLSSGMSYRFIIEETVHRLPTDPEISKLLPKGSEAPSYKTYELVAIDHEGKRLYDRAVCEVHHVAMTRESLPIAYGMPIFRSPQPTREQQRDLFPHHLKVVLGGCVVGTEKTSLEFVCQKCRAAKQDWEEKNAPKK